jgi:hypothetical protein
MSKVDIEAAAKLPSLTAEFVASIIGHSADAINEAAKAGAIPAHRFGTGSQRIQWRFAWADIGTIQEKMDARVAAARSEGGRKSALSRYTADLERRVDELAKAQAKDHGDLKETQDKVNSFDGLMQSHQRKLVNIITRLDHIEAALRARGIMYVLTPESEPDPKPDTSGWASGPPPQEETPPQQDPAY